MAAAGGSALDRLGIVGKLIISVVVLALAAAVYFIAFYTDLANAMETQKNSEKNLQGQLAKAEDARADYQKDLDAKTRKEAVAREQKKVLPDDAEMPAFLAAVQNVATASGISLTSYTPQDEVAGQYYAKVPMALTLSGRFHQVARFFYGVGQLDRIINVEDIDMDMKSTDDEVIVTVKCLTTAFRALKTGEVADPNAGKKHR